VEMVPSATSGSPTRPRLARLRAEGARPGRPEPAWSSTGVLASRTRVLAAGDSGGAGGIEGGAIEAAGGAIGGGGIGAAGGTGAGGTVGTEAGGGVRGAEGDRGGVEVRGDGGVGGVEG
jgi:hypothetical protein